MEGNKIHLYADRTVGTAPSLERCPYFRGSFVHVSVAGTVGTVLIREVS